MRFSAVYYNTLNQPVARSEGVTIGEVQDRIRRMYQTTSSHYHAELFLGEKRVARVHRQTVVWIEKPNVWDHLLEDGFEG